MIQGFQGFRVWLPHGPIQVAPASLDGSGATSGPGVNDVSRAPILNLPKFLDWALNLGLEFGVLGPCGLLL